MKTMFCDICRNSYENLKECPVWATNVQVLQAAHDPGEYISDIIFPPGDGSVFYAVKVGWRNTGGGLYAIPVDCQSPMTSLQVLEIEDPEDIVVSPYGNAAVVASVFGDSLFVLDIGNSPTAPVTLRGKLATANPTLLPANMVSIRRGSLIGNVWVSENVGIRRIRFETDGVVTDVSFTSTGEGVKDIPSAFGIQP